MSNTQSHLLVLLIVILPGLGKYENFFGLCNNYVKHLPKYSCAQDFNIGTGSNGTVFLIRDEKNKLFVLKVQKKSKWSERDIDAMDKLKGVKYIVQMYDQITVNDVHLSILKYGKHKKLEVFMKSSDHFNDIWNLLNFFKKLLQALQSIRKAGLVHSQITFRSIVIDHNYDPLIIDFGMSTKLDSLRRIRGTPMFMAPELIHAMNNDLEYVYTTSVDVYAAGVILFYMMRRHPPFENFKMRYSKMLTTHVNFNKGSSTLFMNVVMKCLQLKENRWKITHLLSFLEKNSSPTYEFPLSNNYFYTLTRPKLFVATETVSQTDFWVLLTVIVSSIVFALLLMICYCQVCLFMVWSKSAKHTISARPSEMNIDTTFIDSIEVSRVQGVGKDLNEKDMHL